MSTTIGLTNERIAAVATLGGTLLPVAAVFPKTKFAVFVSRSKALRDSFIRSIDLGAVPPGSIGVLVA